MMTPTKWPVWSDFRYPHEVTVGPWLSLEHKAKAPINWADAQADLSVRWAKGHFVGFVMQQLTCYKGTALY